MAGGRPAARITPLKHVGSSSTVYVVDDESAVRQAFSHLLTSAGYIVATFGCVEDFLSVKHLQPHSCVVADVRMPGGSGLCIPLKLQERKTPLPVIIVSADDSKRTRDEARAVGVASFFHKPVDGQALIDAVEWAINQRGNS